MILHRVAIKHPLTLCNVVVAQFSGMLEHSVKHPSMNRDVSSCAEVQSLRRQYLGNICRHLVGFLRVIVIGISLRLRLIIRLYQVSYFFNVYLALDMFARSRLQMV